MSFITGIKQNVGSFASENATLLLTVGGVVGTVATAVLAGRGGMKYTEVLREKQDTKLVENDQHTYVGDVLYNEDTVLPKIELKDKALLAAQYFGPAALTGVATIAMIITSHRMSSAKIAGLAAAYGLAERNFSEYKDKVAEKLTGPKKTQIDDELAHEAIQKTPGHEKLVILEGEVLCLDKPGGRYFRCNMETLQTAVIKTNTEIHNNSYAPASYFYKLIGLEPTAWSDDVGFDMDNQLELTFTTDMAPGQKPCIVFEFVSMPKTDYGPKHY